MVEEEKKQWDILNKGMLSHNEKSIELDDEFSQFHFQFPNLT